MAPKGKAKAAARAAKEAALAEPKKRSSRGSCIDEVEDACRPTPAEKPRTENSIEAETLKALKDNFKGYTDFQLRHVLNSENFSIYDRVFQRKTEQMLDPKLPCSKNVYVELKAEYVGNGAPGGFPAVPAGDVQCDALFVCVKACICHNRDFLPMVTYLEAAGSLNTLDLHAVLGTCMKVTPGGKRDECTDFILDVMRFIIRVGHHQSHVQSANAAKAHFDMTFCKGPTEQAKGVPLHGGRQYKFLLVFFALRARQTHVCRKVLKFLPSWMT